MQKSDKVKFLHMYLCSGLKEQDLKYLADIVGTWDNGEEQNLVSLCQEGKTF